MSTAPPPHRHPVPGQLGYLQLPATDVAASARFYEAVFGWHSDLEWAAFEAPGLIGQWITDRPAAPDAGPVLWLHVADLGASLARCVSAGGAVRAVPRLDGGERWLAELADPAGNRVGIVAAVHRARSQTLLTVRDVEASSRWYQALLGLHSDHGGPDYERLLADGALVLQLHRWEVAHHHGAIGDPEVPVGNGVLVWFGEVADFDGVVQRAAQLGVAVLDGPTRNPPIGQGNGPGHRELWVRDPDGYTVVIASPDGEAWA